MPKFNVYMVASASAVVQVEVETGEEAVELAYEDDLPYASHNAGFDLGDWTLGSELFPQWYRPEDDYEEIDD